MHAQRWERFLDYSRRARAKPTFDVEERDPKLKLARMLRRTLVLASTGEQWLPDYERATIRILVSHRPDLINPILPSTEDAKFKALAAPDDTVLRRALSGFLDVQAPPAARFEAFTVALHQAAAQRSEPLDLASVLALGALFNFASSPESLPLVYAPHFQQLETALGYGYIAFEPASRQYEHHLAFAEEVRERMENAGLPVLDMIDVQSLIFLGAEHEDFWASDGLEEWAKAGGGERRQGNGGAKFYLSACASYRDEGPYLAEWIEFHRLVGVEHFFLYDNGSVDNNREILAPYIEEGIVTVYDWPTFPGQNQAYTDCLRWHRFDSRWIAFLDLDTFLFSPTGATVSELLVQYEAWPAVGVNVTLYYTGGHRTKPDGLVIESYLQRMRAPSTKQIKSIVDPTRAIRAYTPHHFLYPYLSAVDENQYPLSSHPAAGAHTKSPSFARLRINHYYTKSEQEFIERWEWAASLYPPGPRGYQESRIDVVPSEILETMRQQEEKASDYDDAILVYAPAVREALARGRTEIRSRRR